MTALEKCQELLSMLSATSFRFRPKTQEPLVAGLTLAKLYEQLSEQDRMRLRDAIQPAITRKLLSLSGLLAENAVNQNDISFVRAGVILHLLDDFRGDYRENIRYLILISFAAKKLSFDFKQIVDQIRNIATERAIKHLNDFTARGDEQNRLEHFGIREEVRDGVFRLVPILSFIKTSRG
jgi:hypothetical protein